MRFLEATSAFIIYALRHTFLTRLGEAGCDALTLARIAGHSSIAMSARYVHPSCDNVAKAFAMLNQTAQLFQKACQAEHIRLVLRQALHRLGLLTGSRLRSLRLKLHTVVAFHTRESVNEEDPFRPG